MTTVEKAPSQAPIPEPRSADHLLPAHAGETHYGGVPVDPLEDLYAAPAGYETEDMFPKYVSDEERSARIQAEIAGYETEFQADPALAAEVANSTPTRQITAEEFASRSAQLLADSTPDKRPMFNQHVSDEELTARMEAETASWQAEFRADPQLAAQVANIQPGRHASEKVAETSSDNGRHRAPDTNEVTPAAISKEQRDQAVAAWFHEDAVASDEARKAQDEAREARKQNSRVRRLGKIAGNWALKGVKLVGRGLTATGEAQAAAYQPRSAETVPTHIDVDDQDSTETVEVPVVKSKGKHRRDLNLAEVHAHARNN